MNTVNQLLAKALTTDSEDEALACMRMGRKLNKGDEVKLIQTTADIELLAEYKHARRLALDRIELLLYKLSQQEKHIRTLQMSLSCLFVCSFILWFL